MPRLKSVCLRILHDSVIKDDGTNRIHKSNPEWFNSWTQFGCLTHLVQVFKCFFRFFFIDSTDRHSHMH
jgi:hypothetical protein